MAEPLIGQCARCGGSLASCVRNGCPEDEPILTPFEEAMDTCGIATAMRREIDASRLRIAELEASNARLRKMVATTLRNEAAKLGFAAAKKALRQAWPTEETLLIALRGQRLVLHWADAIEAGRVL